jgi:hypothetical protein
MAARMASAAFGAAWAQRTPDTKKLTRIHFILNVYRQKAAKSAQPK